MSRPQFATAAFAQVVPLAATLGVRLSHGGRHVVGEARGRVDANEGPPAADGQAFEM